MELHKIKKLYHTKENIINEDQGGPAGYTSDRLSRLFQNLKTKKRYSKINCQLKFLNKKNKKERSKKR